MCNVLVNELGIYDGPYLQAQDQRAVPDRSGQALCPRSREQAAAGLGHDDRTRRAPYNEVAAADMALEGEFDVNGVALSARVSRAEASTCKKFTPEWAEKISTIPAATVRRLAKEFGTEARIGSTIVVDGVTLPYRPVAAIAFRGSQGHVNSVYNFFAVDLLNNLVGAADVVGGCLGFNPTCHGHPDTGKLRYIPNRWTGRADGNRACGWDITIPIRSASRACRPVSACRTCSSFGMTSPFLDSADREELWDEVRSALPPRGDDQLGRQHADEHRQQGGRRQVAGELQVHRLVRSVPDRERRTSPTSCCPTAAICSRSIRARTFPFIFSLPAGMGEWCWPIRQPVLPPDGEQRPFADVLLETRRPRRTSAPTYNAALNAIAQAASRRIGSIVDTQIHLRADLRRRAQEQLRRRSTASTGSRRTA